MSCKIKEELDKAHRTFLDRDKKYGDAYKKKGEIMEIIFPDGILLKTENDFNRFAMFGGVIGKMIRYSAQFKEGGHYDSAHDAIVYATLLIELSEKDDL